MMSTASQCLLIDSSLTQHDDDEMVQRFPRNREFWRECINISSNSPEILHANADPAIRADRELMLHACKINPQNLKAVHESLKADKSFLDQLEGPIALQHLPKETQRQFPELVKTHLGPYVQQSNCRHDLIYNSIAPELWNDREIVLSWFKAGGPFLYNMPQAWRDDCEIFSLLINHQHNAEEVVRHASSKLLKDKEFARNVLAYEPHLFFRFHTSVMRDVDIALLGCCGTDDFRERCEQSERASRSFPRNLPGAIAERVQSLMSAHKSLQTLLLGMSDDSSSGELSRLNLGHETSLSFKKLIADFLGVPIGRQLRQVRTAARNLGVAY